MSPEPAIATLLEAARRAGRGGAPRAVLLLHLSRIVAPRPHHARIARAILLDIAQRLEGEVLRLPSGDLALTCRIDCEDGGAVFGTGKDALPEILERLFATMLIRREDLLTIWHLPRQAASMCAALSVQPESGQAAAAPPSSNPLDAVVALQDFPATPDMLRRQTAVRLQPRDSRRPFVAHFRELGFSMEALESRTTAVREAQADPFVFRHLAAKLDDRLLASLYRQMQSGPARGTGDNNAAGVPLHINLALPGIVSAPFENVVALAREHRTALGVELSYTEVIADPAGFDAARGRLHELGAALILDGVSPAALRMTRPAKLGADLLKLDWSPALSRKEGDELARLSDAMRAIGTQRIVLHRSETEAALKWGLAQGITLFQGRHIDAMLAASRITGCAHSDACSLRQCTDRAAGIGAAAQAGCNNLPLLEGDRQPGRPAGLGAVCP